MNPWKIWIVVGTTEEHDRVYLTEYAEQSRSQVASKVMARARREGFTGTLDERLKELHWEIVEREIKEIDTCPWCKGSPVVFDGISNTFGKCPFCNGTGKSISSSKQTCRSCKWWSEPEDQLGEEHSVLHPLDPDTFEPMVFPFEVRICKCPRILFGEHPVESGGACVIDGSGYMAKLLTAENFSCSLHKPA